MLSSVHLLLIYFMYSSLYCSWRRKWQPTPVFLPGESQGQGALWAAVYRVTQSRTRLKRLSSSSSSLYCWPHTPTLSLLSSCLVATNLFSMSLFLFCVYIHSLGFFFFRFHLCSCMLSDVQLCDPMDCSLPDSSVHGIFPGKNTGVGCHCLKCLSFSADWLH